MDWQQFKQGEMNNLLKHVSMLSIEIENKEITDWTLIRKLNCLSTRIGLLKDDVSKHIVREENKRQESLC